MHKILRSEKGISLLEVMVGMLVFSLGMLLLIPMVVTSITGNDTARKTDMVLQDVQNIVEGYKAKALPEAGSVYDAESQRYVTWWTQPLEPPVSNIEQLNVDVVWEDTQMQYHFRRVSTFIYDK